MHKYFAKTLFLGKKVEFLPECHSTNDELNARFKKADIMEGYLIYTDHQLTGRGQRGNVWLSESGKNLLFSLLVKPGFLSAREGYLLNIITGLAVLRALGKYLNPERLSLKWPNDVYVNDRKIAGVLIETTLDAKSVSSAAIGVGINVNQHYFHLPTATSMLMETGQNQEREVVLEEVLLSIEYYYLQLRSRQQNKVLSEYHSVMRWRGELHAFRSNGSQFTGEILGINNEGKLLVNANNRIKTFDVKEVEFVD